MAREGRREPDPALGGRAHEVDAPARRVHLLAEHAVGRALRQADAAVHAGAQPVHGRRILGVEGAERRPVAGAHSPPTKRPGLRTPRGIELALEPPHDRERIRLGTGPHTSTCALERRRAPARPPGCRPRRPAPRGAGARAPSPSCAPGVTPSQRQRGARHCPPAPTSRDLEAARGPATRSRSSSPGRQPARLARAASARRAPSSARAELGPEAVVERLDARRRARRDALGERLALARSPPPPRSPTETRDRRPRARHPARERRRRR